MIKELLPPVEAKALIQRFADSQKFPLDPFQLQAMQVLTEGRSVLVSAPTGSGKTIVAEFSIFLARATHTRCIYTTPLKALSNQKYRDLREVLGDDLGLVTGDVVINPDAPVLIMTTEILRNILQMNPDQLSDVSQVVLDEAHYMGSEGRGTVWEETIVFLGKHTSIVALSATIPNAEELATWVSAVHKPMDVIYHAERPVPLEGFIATRDKGVEPLFDKRGKLRVKTFEKDGWVEDPLNSQLMRDLHKKEMLPAIFFVFSRLGCEREAIEVLRAGVTLTTPKEQALIRKAVEEAIQQTPGMMTSLATRGWLERLPMGVAPHHAGLLPPLKLLIEILFQRNLLKVVFATETLAAGINMPARTVVISSLSKRTDEGHRMLAVSEFAQMTGRAGRRGMDEVGYAVVPASHRYGVHEVATYFKSDSEPLRSRFTLNFNMVVNLAHRYEPEQAKRIVEQCFSQFQSNATIANLTRMQVAARTRMDELDPACPKHPTEHTRHELLEGYKALKKTKEDRREVIASMEASRQYLHKQDALRAIKAAPFMSWMIVHLPDAKQPQLAILLDKYPVKSGEWQFTVLLEDGFVMRLSLRHLVLPLNVPAQGVPREVASRADKISYMQKARLKGLDVPWERWLEDADLDPDAVVPDTRDTPQILAAKAAYDESIAAMQTAKCFNCNFYRKCIDENKAYSRLLKEERGYAHEIDEIRGHYWRQFQKLHAVLESADFMKGRELLPRGEALAHLRTSNELVAAEVFVSGLLEELTADELCAAASMIVAEPIRGRMNWRPLKPSPRMFQFNDEVVDLARHLHDILEKHGLAEETNLYVVPDYCGMVQTWAKLASWAFVTEQSGIDEGQLVRHLRQTIDMLQQFKDVPGTSPSFQEKVMSAIALLDRDIVKEVF